jgi:DNA helicase-2/ATP-dependent DNA helicase PcrA
MISAYAGCTKSTTLEMAAPGVRRRACALAFNKKIADELRPRMPDNFDVRTLNSIGHRAWGQAINKMSMSPDGNKLGKVVNAVARDNKLQLMTWQWEAVRNGVKEAMQAGLSPNNIGQPLIIDEPEAWKDFIEYPAEDDFELLYFLAHETLVRSIEMAKAGQISFDDQIYCPVILGGIWPRFDYTFVDEAQDLSPLNHVMLGLVSAGLIAAVGDPKQAIYAFRGADSNSMRNMRRLRSSWGDLSLNTTFRCPQSIVARQQSHAPGYIAAPGNVQGRVLGLPGPSSIGGWKWEDLRSALSDIPDARNMAILCRNNAPLMSMAFKLIRNGVGCEMLGRDIGRGLIGLTTKLCRDDETSIATFSAKLQDWLEKETAICVANGKDQRADRINDQAECIWATIEGSSPSTVGDLRETLKVVFDKSNGQVILSSIHKAKGLEWSQVLHLDPWRIPSKQAKIAADQGDHAPMIQENNLRYVGETRTKHTLINASVEHYDAHD